MAAAKQMANLGLKDVGYEYVNSKLTTSLRSLLIALELTTAGPSNQVETTSPVKSFPTLRNFPQASAAWLIKSTLSVSKSASTAARARKHAGDIQHKSGTNM